jgi:hypothetical protein
MNSLSSQIVSEMLNLLILSNILNYQISYCISPLDPSRDKSISSGDYVKCGE